MESFKNPSSFVGDETHEDEIHGAETHGAETHGAETHEIADDQIDNDKVTTMTVAEDLEDAGSVSNKSKSNFRKNCCQSSAKILGIGLVEGISGPIGAAIRGSNVDLTFKIGAMGGLISATSLEAIKYGFKYFGLFKKPCFEKVSMAVDATISVLSPILMAYGVCRAMHPDGEGLSLTDVALNLLEGNAVLSGSVLGIACCCVLCVKWYGGEKAEEMDVPVENSYKRMGA